MRGNWKNLFSAVFIMAVMTAVVRAQSAPRRVNARPARTPAAAGFQRDPVRLVEEFSLDVKTRHLAFDFGLAVAEALGPDAGARLSPRQRAAMKAAFDRAVAGVWETWNGDEPEPVRVLLREAGAGRAVLTLLRGEDLLRIRLAARNGVWFIVEHELLDEALAEFADAFAGVLHPGENRAPVYEAPLESAPRLADQLISRLGEKPELLLMKYRLLESRQLEQSLTEPDRTPQSGQAAEHLSAQMDALLKTISTRWPEFAPGRLARGRALLGAGDADAGAISPLSLDAETAIAELQAYVRLAPHDPRPHRELARAFEQMEKLPEAETALRRAIELDPAYLNHHRALVAFYLLSEEAGKARDSFARMLRAAPDADDAFDELWLEYSEEKPSSEDGRAIEALLLAFPAELESSYAGWSLLSVAQAAQNKLAEAVKSLQRAMALETDADDFVTLSMLYRGQRRFPEALHAASQAVRLEATLLDAHLERACSLAQLGRKAEALAALKQLLKLDPDGYFFPDEPDLQPLAAMPEFKALVGRMKKP
jgi:tetratricopeptide (TPR) repeat protein